MSTFVNRNMEALLVCTIVKLTETMLLDVPCQIVRVHTRTLFKAISATFLKCRDNYSDNVDVVLTIVLGDKVVNAALTYVREHRVTLWFMCR